MDYTVSQFVYINVLSEYTKTFLNLYICMDLFRDFLEIFVQTF